MKKKVALLMGVLMAVLAPVTSLRAESDIKPLFKFVQNQDNTYGYDMGTPVQTYLNSGEQVTIPATYTAPKRQFRTAWVATINNLNLPKINSEQQFHQEYLKILDTFSDWNMNAMIFQVRPLLDAYYPSELNPWSEFITGEQGLDPGYDPLEWMIEQTHDRTMEFHAWFNPYRVTNSKRTSATVLNALSMTASDVLALTNEEYVEALNQAGILADYNFAVLHPEWVLNFDEKLFLNPGIPEVRQFVVDTIDEVMTNYDVDAIHFDDYFYPYRISVNGVNVFFGDLNEDRETFEEYGISAGYEDNQEGIEAWRRDNITALVEAVKYAIDDHNDLAGTAVQFGISPFGIWEHITLDDRGSHTPEGSSQSYSKSIFADTYKWIKDETLDYIIPQIYWSFDQGAAPYGELTDWWSSVVSETRVQLYIGHALYKHVTNGGWEAAWMNPEEIPNQMKFNQKYQEVLGSALFSYNDIRPSQINSLTPADQPKHLAKNEAIRILREEYFNTPALSPAKPWLSIGQVTAPSEGYFDEDSDISFSWMDEGISSKYYVVYRGHGTPEDIIENPENIIAKVRKATASEASEASPSEASPSQASPSQASPSEADDPELAPVTMTFTDTEEGISGADYTYVVTALDAAHKESLPLVIVKRNSGENGNGSGENGNGSGENGNGSGENGNGSGENGNGSGENGNGSGENGNGSGGNSSSSGGGGGSSSGGITKKAAPLGIWKQNAIGWWYQYTDGTWVHDSWKMVNGKWYYFNSAGYMVTGWLFEQNHWYYLNTNGDMISESWLYYQDSWYFLGQSGAMLGGQWVQYQDNWYYLTIDGKMLVSGQSPDGNLVNENGVWIQ